MTRPSPALAALADALLPPGGVLPGAGDVGAPARADALLATLPPALRRAARAELGLLQWLGMASGRPFSALPRARRLALLERLRRLPPPLSEAVTPLLLVPLLAYASAPEVLRALGGHPGPLVPPTAAPPPPAGLPVRSFPDLRPDLDEAFDAVIVGSGAGGAPVARVLARAGWSVAVVEEGGAFTREDFRGDDLDRMRRLYRDGGSTSTLGRPVVLLPLGRAVGGTTVVNSGTCFRTPDRVVDGWRRRFGVDLAPEDLGPYYEQVEETLGVAPVPWTVMGNNGLTAHRGATALGIPGRPIDRNAEGCRGSGQCALGCPVDGKRGVHLNYLPQAVDAGAEILSRCRADVIEVRGSRAVAVTGALLDGDGRPAGRFRIRARRVVVLAAGAPMSPVLLRRSGHRGRGLGSNLRIHPASAVMGVFDEEIDGWRGVLQSYVIDELAGRGVLLESTFPPPSLALAETAAVVPPGEWLHTIETLRHVAVLGLLVSDTSSGRVRGLGPGRTPLMTYSLNRADASRVREGMLLAARVLFAAGAKEVRPLLHGAGRLRSPREAETCLRADRPASTLRLTAYHPMGTVRMGADPGGLVDADGRVLGVDGLVVADAGVFPTSLAVNPQVTIMAFASRAAERILARG